MKMRHDHIKQGRPETGAVRPPTEKIAISFDAEVLAKLRQMAVADRRSVACIVRILIDRALANLRY